MDVEGWRQVLKQGAPHCLVVLDGVRDHRVLNAFVGISPKIRIFVTTCKQGLWPNDREVVLKPGGGMWRHSAAAMNLLALHACRQDVIPEGYQVGVKHQYTVARSAQARCSNGTTWTHAI